MPASVESMFSVKKTPWHRIGAVLMDSPQKEEILPLAGLDWEVLEQPIYYGESREAVENFKATVRSSDNSLLGIVGSGYEIVQNQEMVDFFAPFIDSGMVKITTAGSLLNGKKVWMLGEIQTDALEIAKNDFVSAFLLFSHSHNGMFSLRVGFTPIRVVCANTLALAHANKLSKLLRIKHTKSVRIALETVRETINLASQTFEATAEQYRFLASKSVNSQDLEKYVVKILADKDEGEELSTRTKNTVENVIKLVDSEIPEVRGTWWGAYNSVNYHLNHVIGHSDERRLDSIWFGPRKELNEKSLELALALAE